MVKTQEFNEQLAKEQLSQRGYIITKPTVMIDAKVKIELDRFNGNWFRVGLVADTHLGSLHQQLTHLHTFYRFAKKAKVEAVLHAGDLVEGGRVYRGQEFELHCHGADAQADYAIKHYPKVNGIKTYLIAGNHDESLWKTAGIDVCRRFAEARPDVEYLGMFGASVTINGVKFYLAHGAGGVAYARSYKLQRLIEQFAPEQKPNIVVSGHYHCSAVLPMYRNVIGFQMPCFQSQTPFLKRLGLYPEVGGIILEVMPDAKGIATFKVQTVPFYVPVERDY